MLVIFDCDGVLVDSEPLAAQVFAEHLSLFGVSLSAVECESKFRGHTMDHCFEILSAEYPGALPDDFLDSLADATKEAFGIDLKPVRGVEEVLQWLSTQRVPFCVASNGALSKVRHSLDVTGLSKYFGDHCYSAEQVKYGKPHPDLFLFAACEMGASAVQTIVVEDSMAGVTAAIRAEMNVLRYGAPIEIAQRPIRTFTDMSSLPQIILELLNPLDG